MKNFDLNKIKAEDAANDLDRTKPWRFGYEFKVNLGLSNAGVWDDLPDGSRIWRLNIISKGAKTINFIFDTYRLPRGATIYLYNNDKSDVLGAYTNIFNRPDEMLGTWLVEGENVWIEYHEPYAVRGQGELNISKVIHGYRSVTSKDVFEKSLGDSGSCNQDVECTVGRDFDVLKDRLKHSVGFIIMRGFVCTGTLINNTNNDKAPYFLTANHCDAGDEATWAFRFNWISPNPSCATTDNSTDATINQTTSGATVRASNSKSDMKLLNLDGGLDESWDLEWAGWDRSGEAPDFVVGIHHPSGDIMKVCRDDGPLSKITTQFENPETDMWEITETGNGWELGVTEGGSSGSALFDQNGRIIGQLAGGFAACAGTNDNGRNDQYGRFEVSWDFGNRDNTRLLNWLDPASTGKVTLDMLSQELTNGGTPPVEEEEIIVYYSPKEAIINLANGANKILEYIVFDLAGTEITSGRLTRSDEVIDMGDRSSGMYLIYITDTTDGSSFTKKVIIDRGF
ncbi:hypothetical protein GCM10022258_20250 [Aquimarina gracilis]